MNTLFATVKEYNSLFQNNTRLLNDCMDLINLSRRQKFNKVCEKAPQLYKIATSVIQLLKENPSFFQQNDFLIDSDFLSSILSGLQNSYDSKDYILLADLYEVQVVPLIIHMQRILIDFIDIYSTTKYLDNNLSLLKSRNFTLFKMISTHVYDSQKYQLEFSDSGLISVSISTDGMPHYLTTLQNPCDDGKRLAEHYYEESVNHYIIYGFGMGYHISEMAKRYTNAVLDIFESDLSMLRIAFQFADLTELLEHTNVNIYYDPDFKKMSAKLENIHNSKSNIRFLIHYPSIGNIKVDFMKNWMEDIFTKDIAMRNEQPILISNFKSNEIHYDTSVDTLKNLFCNKTLFIIAAGPSLDKNVKSLQSVPRENCIILAVGTVLKKLLNLNIRPDYFIVSDPNKRVYRQIEGIEDCGIPMIFLSSALKDFALNYKGQKYIVCQNEFYPAENLASKMGFSLYNTGGSVSTTALDIGINLGCKKIIFLGLDLAYTGGYAHATDTSLLKANTTGFMPQVKSVNGEMITASKAFIWFREWIEREIKNTAGIEFIDATEGGAYIEGTIVMSLKEVILTL